MASRQRGDRPRRETYPSREWTMLWGWEIVAVTPLPAQRSPWDPRLLWLTVALAGVVLVGAAILVLLDRWRRSLGQAEEPSANDQLSQFRLLYDQGQLSQEEFERIRNLLTGRLRQELEVPTQALPKSAPAGPENPPPPDAPAPE
jgi:hypothetical protein